MIERPDFYEHLLPIGEDNPDIARPETLALIYHWTQPPDDVETEESTIEWWLKNKAPGSAHDVIGRKGDICSVIRGNMIAYHVGSTKIDPASGKIYTDWARKVFGKYADNSYQIQPDVRVGPNACCIGIEMIPVDHLTGKFSPETLESAARQGAWYLSQYPGIVIASHHEVVGWKDCPRDWVLHPEHEEAIKERVQEILAKGSWA